MLGLEHGRVRLVPHAAKWADVFREEVARLGEALAAVPCRIEHIGSTAVPGLPAKPILDLGVGVDGEFDLPAVSAALTGLGYRYRGNGGAEGGHLFVKETEPRIRTHHLHLVRTDDPQWERFLRFRDHLIGSETAREAYAREKRRLAERFPEDREAYTSGKDRIVRHQLDGAE